MCVIGAVFEQLSDSDLFSFAGLSGVVAMTSLH